MVRSTVVLTAVMLALAADPRLAADGVVIDSGSVIEIHLPPGTVFPDRQGTWTFQGVFTSVPSMDAAGISQTVGEALQTLFSGPGPLAAGKPGISALTAGTSHLAHAKTLLASGDGQGARVQLEEALEDASYQDLPELRVTLASALALGGDLPEALRQLAFVDVRADAPWAKDFAILKSILLLDTSAYADELAWLDQWAGALQADTGRAPLYHFLRALGDRGAKDAASERRELLLVHAPAGTDIGAAAQSLLSGL